jgi:hypothetical protein
MKNGGLQGTVSPDKIDLKMVLVDRVFLRIYDAGLLPFFKITLDFLLALQVLN